MGYDLRNDEGNTFHVGMSGWGRLLDIAQMHGWEPIGVVPPLILDENGNDITDELYDLAEWDGGNYSTNDGQYMLPDDALALANALESALIDIPDVYTGDATSLHNSPVDYWSGQENKARLREFIAYCKQGGFNIW